MGLRLKANLRKMLPARYLWLAMLLLCIVLYAIATSIHWFADGQGGWLMALVSASGTFYGRIGLDNDQSLLVLPLLLVCIATPTLAVFAIVDLYCFALRPRAQRAYRGILTHIVVPVLLVVMVLLMSYQGCRQWFYPRQKTLSWNERIDVAYKTLQLLPLQTDLNRPGSADAEPVMPSLELPVLLNAMRFLAPLITVAAVILGFWNRLRCLAEDLRMSTRHGHVVLCGAGDKGYQLAQQLASRGEQVNVIEVEEGNENLESLEAADVSVMQGNAEDPRVLERAGLLRARHLVIVAGSDSTNIDILMAAASVMRHCYASPRGSNARRHKLKEKIKVVLHMHDPEVCPLLRDERALNSIRAWFDIQVVNLAEMAARDVFIRRVIHAMPVEMESKRLMHFVIIGFGRMGQAIAVQAARMVHLPGRNNYCSKEECLYVLPQTAGETIEKQNALLAANKVRITVVDRDKNALAHFQELNPAMEGLCTFTDADISGNVRDRSVQDRIVNIIQTAAHPDGSGGVEHVPVVFFCMGDDYLNLTTALRLAKELEAGAPLDAVKRIPFYVELSDSSGLSQLLDEETSDTAWAKRLWGFGTIDEVFSPDMVLEGALDRVARSIHENYQKDCPGGPMWGALSYQLRESNRQAADHAHIKLRTLGYVAVEITSRRVAKIARRLCAAGSCPALPVSPEVMADLQEVEHTRWCAEKNLTGYRYGYELWTGPFTKSPREVIAEYGSNYARKNEEKRLHVDLAPWEFLDDNEKQKDAHQIKALAEVFLSAGLLPMDTAFARAHGRCKVKGGKETFEYVALQGLVEEVLPAEKEFRDRAEHLRKCRFLDECKCKCDVILASKA